MDHVTKALSNWSHWLLLAALTWSAHVFAGNEISSVRLSSCNAKACARLQTETVFRSNLQPNLLAFAGAKMRLSDVKNEKLELQAFEAADGYYDLADQVIVLRGLKNSKYTEVIYDLNEGKFIFF